MSAQPKPKVLIAGAGIAGLVAGLSLLQRGIEIEIFEQAAELRELGAGVQLSANGTRVLIALGLEQAMQAIASEPSGKQIRLFSTGRTWKLFDLGVSSRAIYGAPYWMVHRGDFHRVLCEAFNARAPGRLHLDSRCVGFDEDDGGVRLGFANGETRRGDVVVGADGVHSEIRRQIGGDRKPFFAGVAAWRGLVPMERLPPAMQRDVGTNWVGPGRPRRHLSGSPRRAVELCRRLRGRELAGGILTERGTREACRASFAGWNPEIHTLIENIDVPYKWALLGRDPLERFVTGRACLMAMPRIRRCHSSRKAPTWRSRTAWCWRDASSRFHRWRRCRAIGARDRAHQFDRDEIDRERQAFPQSGARAWRRRRRLRLARMAARAGA